MGHITLVSVEKVSSIMLMGQTDLIYRPMRYLIFILPFLLILKLVQYFKHQYFMFVLWFFFFLL